MPTWASKFTWLIPTLMPDNFVVVYEAIFSPKEAFSYQKRKKFFKYLACRRKRSSTSVVHFRTLKGICPRKNMTSASFPSDRLLVGVWCRHAPWVFEVLLPRMVHDQRHFVQNILKILRGKEPTYRRSVKLDFALIRLGNSLHIVRYELVQ